MVQSWRTKSNRRIQLRNQLINQVLGCQKTTKNKISIPNLLNQKNSKNGFDESVGGIDTNPITKNKISKDNPTGTQSSVNQRVPAGTSEEKVPDLPLPPGSTTTGNQSRSEPPIQESGSVLSAGSVGNSSSSQGTEIGVDNTKPKDKPDPDSDPSSASSIALGGEASGSKVQQKALGGSTCDKNPQEQDTDIVAYGPPITESKPGGSIESQRPSSQVRSRFRWCSNGPEPTRNWCGQTHKSRPIRQELYAHARKEFDRLVQYFYEQTSGSLIASPLVIAPKSTITSRPRSTRFRSYSSN